jgi:hypothetical protein
MITGVCRRDNGILGWIYPEIIVHGVLKTMDLYREPEWMGLSGFEPLIPAL